MLVLKHCSFHWTDTGCTTCFSDGSKIESFPHNTPHYYVIAHRCGYGDDLLAYCREHDFFHNYSEEYFHDRASCVLSALAHGSENDKSQYEEIMVQTCQRWVRANERPIIGGVDWDKFRRQAEALLKLLGDQHG